MNLKHIAANNSLRCLLYESRKRYSSDSLRLLVQQKWINLTKVWLNIFVFNLIQGTSTRVLLVLKSMPKFCRILNYSRLHQMIRHRRQIQLCHFLMLQHLERCRYYDFYSLLTNFEVLQPPQSTSLFVLFFPPIETKSAVCWISNKNSFGSKLWP